jgi:hypothetical protein
VTLTVQELAALVGGQFASEAGRLSRRSQVEPAIAEAREGDVTFFANSKYLSALKNCRATAVLVPLDFAETIPPIAYPGRESLTRFRASSPSALRPHLSSSHQAFIRPP